MHFGTVEIEEVQQLQVLVVDDDVDCAETLAILLRRAGHRVQTAFNGHDALIAVESGNPDVVFLDLGLPGVNGYEVAKEIIATATWKRPLLVALTGHGQESDQCHSREIGIDLHLVKPTDPDRLLALLARFRETLC